jgi:uncharacterized protein YjeT (DUF2065 family)
MWPELLRATALVLVVEGILPFLSPRRCRKSLLTLASVEDRWLRVLGLVSMVLGLLLLHLLG